MYRFQCDYTEGAHPAIMQRMIETNMEQTNGYGLDPYCDSARQKIKDLCECQDMDVHFLVGGTQTNTTVISAALRPYQGAVAAVSGHINVHETGAIEATGHKVLPLPSEDGKIAAAQVPVNSPRFRCSPGGLQRKNQPEQQQRQPQAFFHAGTDKCELHTHFPPSDEQ